MTREEVIAWFEEELEYYKTASISRTKRIIAYEMAIEALKSRSQRKGGGK